MVQGMVGPPEFEVSERLSCMDDKMDVGVHEISGQKPGKECIDFVLKQGPKKAVECEYEKCSRGRRHKYTFYIAGVCMMNAMQDIGESLHPFGFADPVKKEAMQNVFEEGPGKQTRKKTQKGVV